MRTWGDSDRHRTRIMADNKQGKVAIPAKNIIQRIGEKSGPIASVGVPKRGYGTMSTQKPTKDNV